MNNFTNSVSKIFKGALTAFKTFPVSIGCALAFAIVAIIRVRFEWVQQDPASFLIDCISWGLALGAIFDLAAITLPLSSSLIEVILKRECISVRLIDRFVSTFFVL